MRRVDFLFEYEVKPREFDSLCLLAAYLRMKGYSTAFVNSWNSILTPPEPIEAEVMLISACYNDDTFDGFTGLAYSYNKVVNMQWEQIRSNYMYSAHTPDFGDFTGVAVRTKHVSWGEKNREWLTSMHHVEECMPKVLGYPPLDFYREEFSHLLIPKKQLFEKYKLDPEKETYLFVSSFSYVGLPESEKIGDIYSAMKDVSIRSQKIILEWFEKFLHEHPSIQLIYRPHPAEKDNPDIRRIAEKYPNFFVISAEAIRHWISACDKLLNWYSTSMIEMFYSGKSTLLLRPVEIPVEREVVIFNNAKKISSYEEFLDAQKSDALFPISPDELTQWYDIQPTPVYKRIGDWLIEIYHTKDYGSRPSRQNVHKKKTLRKVKSWVKHSGIYKAASKWIISANGGGALAKRLEQINAGTAAMDSYKKDLKNPESYICQKSASNYAGAEEIEAKIEMYRKIIEKQYGNDECLK